VRCEDREKDDGFAQFRKRCRKLDMRSAICENESRFGDLSMTSHTINLRVRYPEVDAMGYLHHSRYFQYFEIGRVELLRSLGYSYADLERDGIFFVVVKAECRFKAPAKYDEELTLTTRVTKQTHVRFDHAYELKRGDTLLAEATTTIACVGRDGQLRQIPEALARG
jgi:acyl-CoA thioester hydrolase